MAIPQDALNATAPHADLNRNCADDTQGIVGNNGTVDFDNRARTVASEYPLRGRPGMSVGPLMASSETAFSNFETQIASVAQGRRETRRRSTSSTVL